MKSTSILPEVKDKIYKVKEIGLFYFSRYTGFPRMPKPDISFSNKMQSNESVINTILFKNIDENQISQDADRICSGELRLYGIEPKTFIDGINWHKDYYSGHEWLLRPFNRIYDSNDSGFDLNVPFELSRLQFIPTLLQAHKATNKIGYLSRLIELLDSWIDENPYGFGVNWWSSMDVGLRAVNFVLAITYLAGKIPESKFKLYRKVLWKHGLYIYKYDVVNDRVKNKNNHYLGSMLGMLVVSMCFEGRKASSMKRFAIDALKKEIPRQFYKDGGNFESATGYHQFSLEVVLTAILFIRVYYAETKSQGIVDNILGDGVRDRLSSALDLVWDYMACYGQSPNIGDSSDCRVLVTKDYFSRKASDHSFLFSMGKISIGYEKPNKNDAFAQVYTDSGYGFFRNRHYGIVAYAGPKGTNGTGGHGHNDKCSFVLHVKGQPVFVDSGTYIYNPDTKARYSLKQGKAHNIVMIDDLEQCEISQARVFGMTGDIHTKIDMRKKDNSPQFRMGHDGYRRFPGFGWVFREITCYEQSIVLYESLQGTGSYQVSFFFNLHSYVEVEESVNSLVLLTDKSRITVNFPDMFRVHMAPSTYSPSYHSRMKNRCIEVSGPITLPGAWKTKIHIL
jgi:hypothetical protein